jgi:hypothetical protein
MVVVRGQHRLRLDHVAAQFSSGRDIDARRPYCTGKAMECIGLVRPAEALHQLRTGHNNIAKGQNTSRHHGVVRDRADAEGDASP